VGSDIVSLGVVLYQMATGRPAFRGETPEATIGAIFRETPIEPSALNPEAPKGLDRIVLKALEKNRDARYQSAGELLAELVALQRARQRNAKWVARLGFVLVGLALIAAAGIIASKRPGSGAPNNSQPQITAHPGQESVYSV